MKTRSILLGLAVLAATIALLAEWAVQSLLDRNLPPLLSHQLGLQVELEPTDVDILSLTASTPRLLMGNPTARAVEASNVVVSLSWSDLLVGEMRLQTAAAGDLSVTLSNWPRPDQPRPADYSFLEPWLPTSLLLERGRYISAEGKSWPLQALQWHRRPDAGASLIWSENRAQGRSQVRVELVSLPQLLALQDLNLAATIRAAGTDATEMELKLRVTPDASGGYGVLAQADIAGTQLRLAAQSNISWIFPENSDIQLSRLRAKDVKALLDTFSSTGDDTDFEASLQVSLPRFALPRHLGRVEIGEIRLGDETLVDTVINYSSSAQGLTLDSLTSRGPSAVLEAAGSLQEVAGEWRVQLTADLKSGQSRKSIAARILDADWEWHSGHLRLDGAGATAGAILDALTGELMLQGAHRGAEETPIIVQGRLDPRPNVLALEQFRVELGDAILEGSAVFSGRREKLLQLRLDGRQVDLTKLFAGSAPSNLPGLALPEYLGFLPDIELDVLIAVEDLRMPGLNLAQADFALTRDPNGGQLKFATTGINGGTTQLKLAFETSPNVPATVTMAMQLGAMDVASAFGQESGLFESRVSGDMNYASSGNSIADIFEAMRGTADLSIALRADTDWERPVEPTELLRLTGTSRLVLGDGRIKGVQIQDINIDAIKQHLSGDITMVAGRKPWLTARLASERLDITELLTWMPQSAADADAVDLLTSLHNFGEVNVSFAGGTVEFMEIPLQDVVLAISSRHDYFGFERLDFGFEGSRFAGRIALEWEDLLAEFKASGTVTNILLDDFLHADAATEGVPLSGLVEFAGRGTTADEILSTLKAQFRLEGPTAAPRRQLHADLQRLPPGFSANIKSLAWGDSELRGTVLFQNTSPDLLKIAIAGGTLDLRPWEKSATQASPTKAAHEPATPFSRAALTSSRLVSKMLSTPTQLLSASPGTSQRGRFFNDETIDTSLLTGRTTRINGQLESVISVEGTAKDLEFDVTLSNGNLKARTKAGFLNGGSASAELDIDTSNPVPTADLTVSFKDVHRRPEQLDAPRTGYITFHSRGSSQAELAANLNGTSYLELGRGPLNFGSLSLLSADVATGTIRTLIPGLKKKQPELRCAITLATFTNGIGVTPYGYAARTGTANLMGRIEVDLREEQILMQFRSRSREGVGFSVGNAFSGTVNIRGPLSSPRIIPNTTGLLFRGWAAFMTVGMSVLGETMYNRTLASTNPCNEIRSAIRKDLCKSDQPLAASPIVCPP